MKLDSWNWHDDSWMDTHAALTIEGQGKISIKFFLRAKLDLNVDKMVAIYDGDKNHVFSVPRGFLTQTLVLSVNGASKLRILFEYPEPVAPGDARTMLGAICVIEAVEGQFTIRERIIGINRPDSFSIEHPEFNIIRPYFDESFYRASIAEIRNGADPVLDYLIMGCRTGLDPSPTFSTITFTKSDLFDPESNLSALGQSISLPPDRTASVGASATKAKGSKKKRAYSSRKSLLKDVAVSTFYGNLDGWETFFGEDNFSSCLLAIDTKMRVADVFLPWLC